MKNISRVQHLWYFSPLIDIIPTLSIVVALTSRFAVGGICYNKDMEIKTETEEYKGKTYKVIIDTDGKRYRVSKTMPQYVTKGSLEFQLEWIKKKKIQ